jgi:methyl-accepting chemotaxis protein
MSNNGTYVANPDDQFTGKKAIDVFPEEIRKYKVMEHIAKGEFLSYEVVGLSGSLYYDVYAPIHIGNTGTPWSIGIAVPIDQVMEKANRNFNISLAVGILGLLLLSLVIYFISNSITKPVLQVTDFLTRLSKGQVDNKMQLKITSGDEIEEMSNALNKSIVGLVEKTDFAKDIGNGNLNTNIHLLSDDDILGKSLIEMRNNLRFAKDEEEKRKIEDEKQKWFNGGLALFSDVLRQNHTNIKDYSYAIIQNLINFLKANQGGLFIINDEHKDEIYFDLLASYAFNRKKYKTKQVRMGEGLLGTCAQEKATVYLNNLPNDYIQITSGLGGSNPKCLLMVPLKIEENVLGLIEIASFNEIAKHEIEFVEKIGQNIASTLMSVRVNEQTARLLKQSQQQSEELASQEEEMRQNMEELKATQEEAARKTSEMEGVINALNSTSFVVEYDPDGTVISANKAFLNLFGITKEEIIGEHHSAHIEFTADQKKRYDEFWNDLRNGIVKKEKTKITIKGKSYLLNGIVYSNL